MIIFINPHTKHAVVTACKVASTSLIDFFDSTDFTRLVVENTNSPESVQTIPKNILDNFNKFTFIIRDPKERYVSGIAEVLSRSHFVPDHLINDRLWNPVAMNKKTLQVDHGYRIFEDYNYCKIKLSTLIKYVSFDYSFGLDPHVENWLINTLPPIVKDKEVEVIHLNDLNNWALHTFDKTPENKNKHSSILKRNMEMCIEELDDYFSDLHYYLFSEIKIFNFLKIIKSFTKEERIRRAEGLIMETIYNENGHVTIPNHNAIVLKKRFKLIENTIKK
tara:strand:- start:397 stop:1227 length:831 start_codon:yes stop_codon:yes gene_type:complete